MSETAEVKVKLVLDQRAKDATNELKTGMIELGKETDKVKEKTKKGFFADMAKDMKVDFGGYANFKSAGAGAGSAFKIGFGAVIGTMVAAGALGTAAIMMGINSAHERAQSLKNTSGMMMSFSTNKNLSFGQANEAAKAFENDFRRIGIVSGTTKEEVSAAFQTIGAQSFEQSRKARLTLADTEKLTKAMATVSRVIPGGLGGLTAAYTEMKKGTIDSQGHMVRLITTTGVLKGTAVEVATQLARMTPSAQMQLAEEAIIRMSKQVQNMPMGLEGFKNSLKGVKDGFLERFGEPMLNKLTPMVTKAVAFLAQNGDKIEHVADEIGEAVSSIFNKGGDIIGSFMSMLQDGESGIGKAIKDAWASAKESFQWIYDNREALAKTFSDIAGLLKDVFDKGVSLLKDAGDFISDQMRSDGEFSAEAAKHYKKAEAAAKNPAADKGTMDAEFFMFVEAMKKDKTSPREITNNMILMQEMREGIMKMRESSLKGVERFDQIGNILTGSQGAGTQGPDMDKFKVEKSTEFAAMYNKALKDHNEGVTAYAENVLRGNKDLREVLLKSGVEVEGGMMNLAKKLNIKEFSDDVAAKAKAALGTKAMAPQVVFNNAQFNIKQDFRDQDPERVAIVMRKDIVDAAKYRTGSGLSTPFGT